MHQVARLKKLAGIRWNGHRTSFTHFSMMCMIIRKASKLYVRLEKCTRRSFPKNTPKTVKGSNLRECEAFCMFLCIFWKIKKKSQSGDIQRMDGWCNNSSNWPTMKISCKESGFTRGSFGNGVIPWIKWGVMTSCSLYAALYALVWTKIRSQFSSRFEVILNCYYKIPFKFSANCSFIRNIIKTIRVTRSHWQFRGVRELAWRNERKLRFTQKFLVRNMTEDTWEE